MKHIVKYLILLLASAPSLLAEVVVIENKTLRPIWVYSGNWASMPDMVDLEQGTHIQPLQSFGRNNTPGVASAFDYTPGETGFVIFYQVTDIVRGKPLMGYGSRTFFTIPPGNDRMHIGFMTGEKYYRPGKVTLAAYPGTFLRNLTTEVCEFGRVVYQEQSSLPPRARSVIRLPLISKENT